jgi:hypothetical protein
LTSIPHSFGLAVALGDVASEVVFRKHQVTLGVADQVLDHTLRFRVAAFAEVGAEAIVSGEADVLGMGHHDVGHDSVLQTCHAVAQHDRRHGAQLFEAFGEQAQRGFSGLVAGEAHKSISAPGQDGAEHVQPGRDLGPVDDQMLTKSCNPRSIEASLLSPVRFHLRHRPAQVARRAGVASCSVHWHQSLRRDAPIAGLDFLRDDCQHCVGVLGHGSWSSKPRAACLVSLDRPLDGLVRGAAGARRRPVATQLVIRINDVQVLPRRLQ